MLAQSSAILFFCSPWGDRPSTIITCVLPRQGWGNSNKNEGEQLNDTSRRNEKEGERKCGVKRRSYPWYTRVQRGRCTAGCRELPTFSPFRDCGNRVTVSMNIFYLFLPFFKTILSTREIIREIYSPSEFMMADKERLCRDYCVNNDIRHADKRKGEVGIVWHGKCHIVCSHNFVISTVT